MARLEDWQLPMVVDPLNNQFFGNFDMEAPATGIGTGQGGNALNWHGGLADLFPELVQQTYDEGGPQNPNRTLDGRALQEALQGRGWQLMEQYGDHKDTTNRWVQDAQGNRVGETQTTTEDPYGDLRAAAAVIAGGYFGGNALANAYGGGMTAAQASAMNPEMYGMATQTGLGGGTGGLGGISGTYGGVGALGDASLLTSGATSGTTLASAATPNVAGGIAGSGGAFGGALQGLSSAGGSLGSAASSAGQAAGSNAAGSAPDWLRTAATVAGGLAGAQEQPGATATNVRTLDPRIDSRVFGEGGLMANADQWFQANKTGQNEQMRQAQQWTRGLLSSPEATQGLAQMASTGRGLLAAPVAANPFLNWRMPGG